MEAFVIGDLVELLSGGPVMTVNNPRGMNDLVSTQWFAGKKLENGRVPAAALKKVTVENKD